MVTYLDELLNEVENEDYEAKTLKEHPETWLKKLPLIICGPILRKVHYRDVSVWLAFKEEVSDIKIKVFESGKASTTILFGTAEPIKLGKNLFVSLITATPFSPTGLDVKLKSDIIYGYTISFTHEGKRKGLNDNNVLKGGINSIVYGSFGTPTFCLPSDNINNLKIVHGSCRKPHGGSTDALRALDTMLEIHGNNIRERPQLLCLTGDQIYADDVADALLYKIRKIENILFGWQEALPIDPKRYSGGQLYPGNRKNLIAKTGNKIQVGFLGSLIPGINHLSKVGVDDLTTTDAKSHLIFLGEFILMYLFTYSDSFLSEDDWPAFEEVHHSIMVKKDPFDHKPPTRSKYFEAQKKAEQIRTTYDNEVEKLKGFARSLPFIKKALANISSVMIFDDHDVTDDWFISKEWCKAALTENSLSRRYILNSLLAYVIFQDWGNRFAEYKSGDGLKILQALTLPRTENHKDNYIKRIDTRPNPFAKELEKIILPVLNPIANTKDYCLVNNAGWRWHYKIDYNSICIFVLNTRTERQFYEKEAPLPSILGFDQLGYCRPGQLAIIVSATPVFGNIPMELGQEKLRLADITTLTGIIARADGSGHQGMYEHDQESWSFSNKGFSRFLDMLANFKKVLILSGEVHYAFTAYIRLWKKSSGGSYQLTQIVQSTSSALKNSSEKTHWPATNSHDLKPDSKIPYKMVKITGKSTRRGWPLEKIDNPRYEKIKDYVGDLYLKNATQLSLATNIQYSVLYIKRPTYNFESDLFKKIRATNQHMRYTDGRNVDSVHDVVIGKDSISLLSFTNNSITNNIWFAVAKYDKPHPDEDHKLLYPYASHKVVFNDVIKPDELPLSELKKMSKVKVIIK
jgi:hypothetical protein